MSLPLRTVPVVAWDDRTGLMGKAWYDALVAAQATTDDHEARLVVLEAARADHETRIAAIESRLGAPVIVPITVFTNGWTNFNTAVWTGAGYWIDERGLLHMQGLIAAGTIGLSAFTLPAEARPALKKRFAAAGETPPGYIDVLADGTLIPQIGTNGFYSLDTVAFLPGT